MNKIKTLIMILGLSLSATLCAADTVNINTADMELLMSINGIGTRRAEQIINYRQEHGAFKSVQELTNIRGIGQAVVDRNMEVLTVEAPVKQGP